MQATKVLLLHIIHAIVEIILINSGLKILTKSATIGAPKKPLWFLETLYDELSNKNRFRVFLLSTTLDKNLQIIFRNMPEPKTAFFFRNSSRKM